MPDQKQNGPIELELEPDLEKITLTSSISYSTENIPQRDPVIVDGFVGTVRDFRQYLRVMRMFLRAGVIAP